MKTLIMLLGLCVAGLGQQGTFITLRSAIPPAPTATASVVGTPGNTSACYWVVVRYTGGYVLGTPSCSSIVPNTLGVSNYMQISWNRMQGALSYDVLKTTNNIQPNPGASVSLTTATTATSYSDQGGATSAYTLAGFPYGQVDATLWINNRDYATPRVELLSLPFDPLAGITIPAGQGNPATSLVDSNGNTVVDTSAATTPVNWWRAGNSATSSAPSLAPVGSDANIDALINSKGTGDVKVNTNFVVDETGAATGGVIYNITANTSIANVNTGVTLLAGVTGRTLKVVNASFQALGGAVGTCTAVVLSDTAGSPVTIASAAQAQLTQNTVLNLGSTGVTPGTIFTALTADKGIQISKTGGACDTATSVRTSINYTIN